MMIGDLHALTSCSNAITENAHTLKPVILSQESIPHELVVLEVSLVPAD